MEHDRCVDYRELRNYVPFSRAHIDRLETNPDYMGDDPFPGRVQVSKCRVCWWLGEVTAWVRRRPRQRARSE
jgi:predicted DNA-binding transcriptional regulator AlpA